MMDWYINTSHDFKVLVAIFLSSLVCYIIGYLKGKGRK